MSPTTTEDSKASRPQAQGAYLGLLGMALLLFWLGYSRPPGLKVPSSVALLLSFVLIFATFALAAKQAGRTAANHALAAVVLLGFSVAGDG